MKIGKVLGLAALAGGGFAAYRIKGKMGELKGTFDQVIAFSGQEKDYEEFDGASIAVIFAGLELDLTKAQMTGDSATLKIYGEYCGIDIKVPAHWNVKAVGTADKAGVENSVVFDGDDTTSKLLIIDYEVKYAGLQIREGKHEAYPESVADVQKEVEVEEDSDMEAEF